MKKRLLTIFFGFCFFACLMCMNVAVISANTLDTNEIYEDFTLASNKFTPYVGSWLTDEETGVYRQTDDGLTTSAWHRGSYFRYAYKDFTMEFKMRMLTNQEEEGWCGIVFRKSKPTDVVDFSGYSLIVKPYNMMVMQNWSQLYTFFMDPIAENFSAQDWHVYRIQAIENRFNIFVDDNLVQSILDNSGKGFSGGFISLNSGMATMEYDYVKIAGEIIGDAELIDVIGAGNIDINKANSDFNSAINSIKSEDTEPEWYKTFEYGGI